MWNTISVSLRFQVTWGIAEKTKTKIQDISEWGSVEGYKEIDQAFS